MLEELELLAEKQRELDKKRVALNASVEDAFKKLQPLREQMKMVMIDMSEFNQLQADYADLSRRTYEMLGDSVQSVEKEILQTQNLLKESDKLSKDAMPIHLQPLTQKADPVKKTMEEQKVEKSETVQEVSSPVLSRPEVENFFTDNYVSAQKEEDLEVKPEIQSEETLVEAPVTHEFGMEEAQKGLEAFVNDIAGQYQARVEIPGNGKAKSELFFSELKSDEYYSAVCQEESMIIILSLPAKVVRLDEILERELLADDSGMEISFAFHENEFQTPQAEPYQVQAEIITNEGTKMSSSRSLFSVDNTATISLRNKLIAYVKEYISTHEIQLSETQTLSETEERLEEEQAEESELDKVNFDDLEDLSNA